MAAKRKKAPNRSNRRPVGAYCGRVRDGKIKLDRRLELPDGTAVLVTPVRTPAYRARVKPASAATAWGAALLKHAGIIKGLPADFASQHDHYIHGTPKR